jgi:hypothetical protein
MVGAKTGHRLIENERRDAFAAFFLVGDRHRDAGLPRDRVGDEIFRAVDQPTVILAPITAHGGRPRAGRIGTGLGFGQAPGAEMFALYQRDQIFLLLLFRAEHKNMIRAEGIMRRHAQGDRTADTRQLFDNGRIIHVAQPRAAVFFGKDGPGQI